MAVKACHSGREVLDGHGAEPGSRATNVFQEPTKQNQTGWRRAIVQVGDRCTMVVEEAIQLSYCLDLLRFILAGFTYCLSFLSPIGTTNNSLSVSFDWPFI